MALLKRFDFTILNAAGEPVNGCSVEVRKQGATANAGGSLTTIAVHQVGAIVAGDTVAVDTGVSTVLVNSVAGPSPMQVVVASAITVTNDVSRLTPTGLPTIYNDVDGTEAKANPLTTDTNGYAFCYAPFDFVDTLIAATTAGTAPSGPAKLRLVYDQGGAGNGTSTSSIIDSNGASTAFVFNTTRALVNAGSKIASFQVNSVEKAFIDATGAISGATITTTGAATFSGLITGNAGLTISAGSVSLPAGSVISATLAANAVHPAPSTITGTSTDVAVGTSETVRITTSYTPVSGNVGVRITVNVPYFIQGNNLSTTNWMELRLYVGGVLKAKGRLTAQSGANEFIRFGVPVAFTWEEPAMAASPTTIEVRDIKDSAGPTVTYQGATVAPGYITIQELKK